MALKSLGTMFPILLICALMVKVVDSTIYLIDKRSNLFNVIVLVKRTEEY